MMTDMDVSVINVYRLVEKVRSQTNISHDLSCRAVATVLNELLSIVPESISWYVKDIVKYFEEPLEAPDTIVDNTEDMCRLLTISEELSSAKNDSQQRSWELFEDEIIITGYLTEFNCLMKDADMAITKHFLCTNLSLVNCLAEYYQMETRWSIRKLLLEAFTIMSNIHRSVCLVLFNSVLPLELSRDIRSNNENMHRLVMSIDAIGGILFIDEPIPVTYSDDIGKDFILHLLYIIENKTLESVNLPEKLVNFIVVYNYTFSTGDVDNNVTSALLEYTNPNIFTQTLLFLLNRGKDPVKEYRYISPKSNSLIKLMIDLFSRKDTISIFYKNDVEVFIDIVVRQLTDISCDDGERKEWLLLVHQILLNCEQDILQRRILDLLACFSRILDEDPCVDEDIVLVRKIRSDFSDLFDLLSTK